MSKEKLFNFLKEKGMFRNYTSYNNYHADKEHSGIEDTKPKAETSKLEVWKKTLTDEDQKRFNYMFES